MDTRSPYLIIGNSAAAVGGVAGIRNVDTERPITLVSKEPHHTYSRPLISYLLGGEVDESRMPYRPPDFYEKNNIRSLLGVEVIHVDSDARVVTTTDGRDLAFEKLLIATGGKPILPDDVSGKDIPGVFTFTTWEDARSIQGYIKEHSVERVVVVGGGLIGLKSVEALIALGLRVTVVELTDRILGATFDDVASDMAKMSLQNKGVQVCCGTTVSAIKKRKGRVSGVTLGDGPLMPCDMVIFAIGVTPNTRVIAETPIETDRGILVDETMQTSVEGIYAAGDVAQAADLLSSGKRPIPILPLAYRQGFVAGSNMAGEVRTYEGGLAMNAIDICGLPTVSVGMANAEGDLYETLSSREEDEPKYKKIVIRDGRIVGAVFVGDVDRAGIITGLIKSKVDVASFKHLLLTEKFGLICLPKEYRKHVVSGRGVVM